MFKRADGRWCEKRQDFAKKTVTTQLLVLNLIFKYAKFNDRGSNNPCELIEPPKNLKKTKRQMPTEADIQTLLLSQEKKALILYRHDAIQVFSLHIMPKCFPAFLILLLKMFQ
ncbi:MAG: hypothetical protein IJ489_00880 [Clostridia bacterium]|nr:hypothetical protein [Clostridia bacterium]